MSKIISFKEGKKNLLENRKEKQIPISQKTINQRETKKATPQSTEPEMGILIWLYCPNCKTLQYTENQASNGRKHKCGADVMEIEVPLDLTAENTICLKNLSILEELQQQIKEKKLWEQAGLKVQNKEEAGGYPTPREVTKTFNTHIGRVREDLSSEKALCFWCVADQLYKGAALNAIEIAEEYFFLRNQNLSLKKHE